jgi:poly(A) polymerase
MDSGVFAAMFPFYGELLAGRSAAARALRKEILAVLGVLDRLYTEPVRGGKVVIDDYMLFAVLLYPWAEQRFALSSRELKGAGYHQLTREIRGELNEVFSHRLNLKRMARDAITTLFVNLPAFIRHGRDNSWPAWLRKKSYFTDCSRFHGICREAAGEGEVDTLLFVKECAVAQPLRPATRSGRSGGARRGNNPAFSSSSDGVFGLRRG